MDMMVEIVEESVRYQMNGVIKNTTMKVATLMQVIAWNFI